LLYSALVHSSVVPTSPSKRSGSAGFTLMELMVVVLIITVVTALAIPTMIVGHSEGHVYNDAAQLSELLRTARTRAIGRGTATAVSLTTSNSWQGPDRGTFTMYEAQTTAAVAGFLPNTGGNAGTLFAVGTPMTACAPPTTWPAIGSQIAPPNPAANGQFLNAVNMNGTIETQATIFSLMNSWVGGAASPQTAAWVCYTPLGRAYLSLAVAPTFVAGSPMTTVLSVDVERGDPTTGTQLGITRTVVIPPSGAARIISH
jgi:prepilin-type N-terminal cleavage/methylation domain-containing protein